MSFRARDVDEADDDSDGDAEDDGGGGDVHSTMLHITDGRGSTSVTTSRMMAVRWAMVEASNHLESRTLPCLDMSIIQ